MFLNQLEISSAEKNTLEKKCEIIPPLLKFLATPLPALVVGEEKLVIGFWPPHFRNASAIAASTDGDKLGPWLPDSPRPQKPLIRPCVKIISVLFVPHVRLLSKLSALETKGTLNNWNRSFLCDRKEVVVVDGFKSRDANSIDF